MAYKESELTAFLQQLKQADPTLDARQREARAYWWDRHSGDDNLQRWQAARPARGSYVYYHVGKNTVSK